jgi:uridine kinase
MAPKPYFIAIVGPSGAGKSTLSQGLQHLCQAQLGLAAGILAEDDYYHPLDTLPPELRATQNFDTPNAIEHSLLERHLEHLAQGQSIQVPRYDYVQQTRVLSHDWLHPTPVVFIEGLFLFNQAGLRNAMTQRIYVSLPMSECLARRLVRDQQHRGRSEHSIVQQFKRTVQPGYEQFIAPSARYADTIIDGLQSPTEVLTATWAVLSPKLAAIRNTL